MWVVVSVIEERSLRVGDLRKEKVGKCECVNVLKSLKTMGLRRRTSEIL